MSDIRATDLFAAIGHSVQEAQIALQEKESQRFWSYFTTAERKVSQEEPSEKKMCSADSSEECLVPKVRVLRISPPLSEAKNSNEVDAGKTVFVPVASIVSHNQLSLEEVRIRLFVDVKVKDGELFLTPSQETIRRTLPDFEGTADGVLYGAKVTSETKAHSVELVFRRGEEEEGIAKVVRHLNNMI